MEPWKITFILLVLTIASVIIHNLIYAAVGFEEAIFFLLTFVFGAAAIIMAFYSLFKSIKK